MIGPFGAATVFGSRTPPLWAARLNLAIQKWRLGQLVVAFARSFGARSSDRTVWDGMNMFLQNQIALRDPRRETVYRHFKANLRDILRAGEKSGAQIILSTMAVNLRNCPPFASVAETNQPEDKREQFREQYRHAIEMLPENWAAHFELGGELDAANRLPEALLEFKEAVRLNPNNSRTHFNYAVVLAKENRLDEAGSEFQTTLRLEPDSQTALTYLAEIRALKKPKP